jgi:hypothetical protein
VFDPIDGSKNIDASLPVGTIFGIYRKPEIGKVTEDSFLQDGRGLVAAGYCLYSATTVLVLTLGSGVDGYVLVYFCVPSLRLALFSSIFCSLVGSLWIQILADFSTLTKTFAFLILDPFIALMKLIFGTLRSLLKAIW